MTEPGPDDRSRALETLSEDELLASVRAGDIGVYAELYRRHLHEALRLARSLGGPHDPDDVAQEAFLKVLRSILRGAGPRRGFAPYLLRTVRNDAIDRARRTHEDAVEDLEDAAPDSFVSPDGVDELFDRQLVRTAFEGLPETWRRILWLTEVEGETPRALAPQLGRSPNAISQLSRRAREGLRSAWLQAHLDVSGAAPTCRSVARDLDAHENGRLAPARSAAVASHLETCARCAAARDELRGLAVQLRAILLPLVLGSPLLLERHSADVAAVGPSALDLSGPDSSGVDPTTGADPARAAPTTTLDPLAGAGLVRGALIAHAGAVATLGALAVLAVGGTLLLGVGQKDAAAPAAAQRASSPGIDSEDDAQATDGSGTGSGDAAQGADGAADSADAPGTDPTAATAVGTGGEDAASAASGEGAPAEDATLSPVQLPVVAPVPEEESPTSAEETATTEPEQPTRPGAPGPGPASADEESAGPTSPAEDAPSDTPQEPTSGTGDDPSGSVADPAGGPAPLPPKHSSPPRPPLPGMPAHTPTPEPTPTAPSTVDPAIGGSGGSDDDGAAGEDGSGDDGAVPDPVSAPGPQLVPSAEDPGDAPGDEAAEF